MVPLLFAAAFAQAAWKDDVGHAKLADELGGGLPTGTNITVSHVEAPLSGNYMPDEADAEFTGKTFTNVSDSSNGVSSHATTVGKNLYGNATSMAPDINAIDNYEANDWLGPGFLHTGASSVPEVETNRIQNHSWIGNDHPLGENIIRRLDYAIARDDFVCVVGLNNSTSTPIPQLLAHTYNGISVGRTSGGHSRGQTTFDEAGRVKPEIVAPLGTTSAATPAVGSAAALLMEVVDGDSSLTNAGTPEGIKALLLAGATKDEFPDWDRTEARPLDDIYGAGELNIYNSYRILVSGEQEAGGTSVVERLGWDGDLLASGATNLYFFDVPESNAMTRLSVLLAWLREFPDGPDIDYSFPPALANMSLELYEATNFTLLGALDASTSQVDNVEHIYQRNLLSGRYALAVTTDTDTDFVLAWFSRTALIPHVLDVIITNGLMRLEATVTEETPYGIEATTNLLDSESWALISTNTSSTNILEYTDPDSAGFVERFYRVVPDP